MAGPPLVRAATGEIADAAEMGGAEMHATVSGTVEHLAENDTDGIRLAREVMARLNWESAGRMPTQRPRSWASRSTLPRPSCSLSQKSYCTWNEWQKKLLSPPRPPPQLAESLKGKAVPLGRLHFRAFERAVTIALPRGRHPAATLYLPERAKTILCSGRSAASQRCCSCRHLCRSRSRQSRPSRAGTRMWATAPSGRCARVGGHHTR